MNIHTPPTFIHLVDKCEQTEKQTSINKGTNKCHQSHLIDYSAPPDCADTSVRGLITCEGVLVGRQQRTEATNGSKDSTAVQ